MIKREECRIVQTFENIPLRSLQSECIKTTSMSLGWKKQYRMWMVMGQTSGHVHFQASWSSRDKENESSRIILDKLLHVSYITKSCSPPHP